MDKVIEFDGIFNVAVGVGGFAALLGALSLWLRYKEVVAPWARRLCLFSDILNTTFVSITVVGVLSVSFSLVIHLPELARSDDIDAVGEKVDQLRRLELPAVDLSGLATSEEIQRLISRLERQRGLDSTIKQLIDGEQLSKGNLQEAVIGVLGEISYFNAVEVSGDAPMGEWQCVKEGEALVICDIP